MSRNATREAEIVAKHPSLRLISHPLIEHKLTRMRSRYCSFDLFRRLAKEISILLIYEAARNFLLSPVEIETEDDIIQGFELKGRKAVITPIIRSGLILAEGAMEIMPAARIGHIGIDRINQDNNNVEEYMTILPDPTNRDIILMDAVIGTGHTACCAIKSLKNYKIVEKRIKYISLLVSPEGISKICLAYPEVDIYAAGLEDGIDEKNHVVPGFGDASDKLFGIKHFSTGRAT